MEALVANSATFHTKTAFSQVSFVAILENFSICCFIDGAVSVVNIELSDKLY